jgi:hypothetical protein
MQVYNLKVDDKTHKSDASIEYRVMKDKEAVLKFDETSDKLGEHGEEIILQRALTLGALAPGKYKLEVQVTDNLAKQTISPSAEFTVTAAPK